MSIQLFLSGAILGLLVGIVLEYCLLHRSQRRKGMQREIDHLVEQFQELFRQIDQDKGV